MNDDLLELIVSFVAYFLILIQARLNIPTGRLKKLNFIIKPIVRNLFYLWPIVVVAVSTEYTKSIDPLIIIIIVMGAFAYYRRDEITLYFNSSVVDSMANLSGKGLTRSALTVIGGSISQEIFYRYILLFSLGKYIGPLSILLTALMFAFEHRLHEDARTRFLVSDYVSQFVLGLSTAFLVWHYGAIHLAVFMHCAYNLPMFIVDVRRSSIVRSFKGGEI